VFEEDVHQFSQHVVRGHVELLDDAWIGRAGDQTWSRPGVRAIAPPSPPVSATVSMPTSRAVSRARRTLAQSPSVEMPSAMSAGSPMIRSWWAKTSSRPTRLATPVTVATSAVSECAGSALADDHGVDELDRHVLGVGAGAAVAEDDELAAAVEAPGHAVARLGHRRGVVGQGEHRGPAALEEGRRRSPGGSVTTTPQHFLGAVARWWANPTPEMRGGSHKGSAVVSALPPV
jgi:hypothetical protein